MIDLREALSKLSAFDNELEVNSAYDYDDDWFLFEALKKGVEVDYDAPFYAVNKADGRVTAFTPAEDFDAFFDCIDNRKLSIQ